MKSDPLVVKNGFGTSCLLFWQILIENGGVYAEFVTQTDAADKHDFLDGFG